ncbi:hypothetical protein mRhiFer1_009845 [Rhinolophus ferrumequinum]|uniref:Secreted protein n=1 Tax=Rhinolophus ferrumequinum TaxID=59479 RepID=A0A7J7YTB6_RHIFE|nr:hypothetical protein mRhiFer1_009845 [Rhinolophus ferrumequinum]
MVAREGTFGPCLLGLLLCMRWAGGLISKCPVALIGVDWPCWRPPTGEIAQVTRATTLTKMFQRDPRPKAEATLQMTWSARKVCTFEKGARSPKGAREKDIAWLNVIVTPWCAIYPHKAGHSFWLLCVRKNQHRGGPYCQWTIMWP